MDDKQNTSLTGNFVDPEEILKQIEIKEGDVVADFGCGAGYFSLPIARIVGDLGKVYSFDILPQALESVESKAKILGLRNVVTQRANLERIGGSKLEEALVDWVILKDMLFQNEKKDLILGEAARILKSGGKILLIEWNEKKMLIGPDAGTRVLKGDLLIMADSLGLKELKELKAGDFHYSLVLEKK